MKEHAQSLGDTFHPWLVAPVKGNTQILPLSHKASLMFPGRERDLDRALSPPT